MGITENLMKWQNYAHYLLLTIILVVIFHFMGVHQFHTEIFLPNLHFVYLFLAIFIADTIIHALFYIAPKPIQWRD